MPDPRTTIPPWREIATLRVKVASNGLYAIECDGIDGFYATGSTLTKALEDVPTMFRELAGAGVKIAKELRRG